MAVPIRTSAAEAPRRVRWPAPPPGPTLLGDAPALERARQLLGRIAPLQQCVLVHGETGTGKELAARFLHDHGPRRQAPFVAINCGAIPGHLAESELFGHCRGAFTGAHRDRPGAFVRAGAGTLFLDEIGELPLSLQAKLLRTLELGTVLPVGAESEVRTQARIVTATHRDLPAMVAAGSMREDLVHRLAVLVVELPPLRDRRRDIPQLVRHFAELAALELRRPVRIDPEAIARAQAYDWPGNLRGLKNAVLRAAVHGDGHVTAEGLCQPGPWSIGVRPRRRPSADGLVVPRGDFASMKRSLLQQVLAEVGSIRQAAMLLDIPRSTLGNWIARDPELLGPSGLPPDAESPPAR